MAMDLVMLTFVSVCCYLFGYARGWTGRAAPV